MSGFAGPLMPKKRILIVDDEPEIVEIVKERLEANGYETLIAHDGEECLREIQKSAPDLTILDIAMPKLDGLAVLRKIRGDRRTAKIPVVMLTAKRQTKFLFEVQQFDQTDYLMKPFEAEDLLNCIKRYL